MAENSTSRLRFRILFLVAFVSWCWLAMMAVHELGHVLAAAATGGTVTKVVLHPLAISRTDVVPNPAPLLVVWAGPVVGSLLPILVWRFLSAMGGGLGKMGRFFAGFCLIANGAYIGVGSFDGVGDAGVMLGCDAPIWLLWLFGVVAVAAGLFVWHGLGPRFGLPGISEQKMRIAAAGSMLLLTLSVVVELVFMSFQH